MKRSSFYNKEGYPDPTYFFAEQNYIKREKAKLAKLHAYRPIVFVCSPLRGDVKANQRNARRYCRFAVKKGYLPIAPHLFFPQFLNDADEREREIGIFMGMVLLTKCTEIWVFGEKVTEGMKREIKKAKWRGIPVKYFTEKLEERK